MRPVGPVLAGVVAAVIAVAGCAGHGPDDESSSVSVEYSDSEPVAGGIVRVVLDGHTYDLDIERDVPRTDAGDPPPCFNKVGSVQFALNWAASDRHRPAPAVTISLLAPDGTYLVIGDRQRGCHPARRLHIEALPKNSELVLPAVLPNSQRGLTRLRVVVNDAATVLPVTPICPERGDPTPNPTSPPCSPPPLEFETGQPGSVVLRVP